MIKVYYRISDKNRKGKAPDYFSNKNCLDNFLNNFNPEEITIIADNVKDETYDWLLTYNKSIKRISLGNVGSLKFTFDLSIKNNDEDIVYFVENDYLHTKDSKQLLEEAFEMGASYVSLYDHPDKYTAHYNINYDRYVDMLSRDVGYETLTSKIYYGKTSYWRTTPSTCMTFATKVKTFKEDYDIINKMFYDQENNLLKNVHDHGMFLEFWKKGRVLISPIPGAATHGDMLSPHVIWKEQLIK